MNDPQPARWWEVAIGKTLFMLLAIYVSLPRRQRKSRVVIEHREAA